MSCSICPHHKTNPTPKMASPYLALPTHHPEKYSKIVIERVRNGIQNIRLKRKVEVRGMLLLLTRGFTQAGVYSRRQFCGNLEVYRPPEPLWNPRLREAAATLAVMRGRQYSETMKRKIER